MQHEFGVSEFGVRVKLTKILANFTLTPNLPAVLCVSLLVACNQTGVDKPAVTSSLDDLMQNLVLPEDRGGSGMQNPVFDIIIPDEYFEYSFASGQALA